MNEADTSYFLPYQEAWINDDSPLKVAEKSRRVGFTYASSYRMFQKCMRRGKGFTQWVSSRDRLTAQELIRDYIAMWCKLANVAAQGLTGEDIQVIDTEKDITAFVCTFPNGARIVSLSSTPEAFAGKGGDVFLDEVDLHRDSGALIDMAYPCIMWGNQLEMVSAYRVDGSKDTPFARLVAEAKKDNPQHASLHRVTIHDAVAQGLVEKINAKSGRSQTREEFLLQTRAGCRTLAAWESQFECKVQDAGGKLLKTANYAACEYDSSMEIPRIIPKVIVACQWGILLKWSLPKAKRGAFGEDARHLYSHLDETAVEPQWMAQAILDTETPIGGRSRRTRPADGTSISAEIGFLVVFTASR